MIGSLFTFHCSQVYYYNTMTGESSWERPQGFQGDAEKIAEKPKPVASERIEGTDWTEVKCEDKRKYYFNVVSQVLIHQVQGDDHTCSNKPYTWNLGL